MERRAWKPTFPVNSRARNKARALRVERARSQHCRVLVPLACGLAQCVEQQFSLQQRQLGEHLQGRRVGRSARLAVSARRAGQSLYYPVSDRAVRCQCSGHARAAGAMLGPISRCWTVQRRG
jgi:hypothetical protein